MKKRWNKRLEEHKVSLKVLGFQEQNQKTQRIKDIERKSMSVQNNRPETLLKPGKVILVKK